MDQYARLLAFLNDLEAVPIHYSLTKHTDNMIMVNLAVPGERWEVEFATDGQLQVERFVSDGVGREEKLAELYDGFIGPERTSDLEKG